jgi:hypothetical protein
MKRQSIHLFVVGVLALLGPLAGQGRGDFVLTGDQWFTVNSGHTYGTLRDRSCAFIVPDGWVYLLQAYDFSSVDISGGFIGRYLLGDGLYAYDFSSVNMSGGSVSWLSAYDSSDVYISGGSVTEYLQARNSSSVNITGGNVNWLLTYNFSDVDMSSGYVYYLESHDSSAVDFTGGSMRHLSATDSSSADITGGRVQYLFSFHSSTVDISGGDIALLYAWDDSDVTFYGQNFSGSDGLFLDGDRVLGTGNLSGEWMDGTRWSVNIGHNDHTATILAIPEPATLLLLGLGSVILRRKTDKNNS